jgi:hypothetical protein
MESVVRTIYASHIQTNKFLKDHQPFTILPNSTLNQKFNLFPNEVNGANEIPSLGYIGIGNKGASYDIGADNYVLTKPIPHLPRHASLYNFIPFVAKPTDNDLAPADREKYRMRVITTISGKEYALYYLKKFDMSNVTCDVELRNVNDGVITTTPFTPQLSDLSPTPPTVSNTNLNNPNGDYLVSTAKLTFTLNQDEINNIIDACVLLYNDERYAVINEIALCTGIDRTLSGQFGNTTAPYTEVVVAQVAAFISQYNALYRTTTSLTRVFDIGAVDPLLV